jgi:predicted TIM-barrel fold metal-dependent hydrolase
MKIFDCHTHIENSWDTYNLKVEHKNIIFNSLDSFDKFHGKVDSEDSISLIFDYRNLDRVREILSSNKINAFKIHSREQHIGANEHQILLKELKAFNPQIPIIFDAFYYGHELEYQPSLPLLVDIAKQHPDIPIIVAHSGGHKVFSYFLHLRSLKNIYYDLSFSLQYLSDSSVLLDLIKLIKYTPSERVMFGSDYHWADAKLQYDILMKIVDDLKLSQASKEDIFYKTAARLFLGA